MNKYTSMYVQRTEEQKEESQIPLENNDLDWYEDDDYWDEDEFDDYDVED